jgi:Putative transmembrane protein (PGPGW)
MVRRLIVHSARTARRVIVAVVGATVLLLGVALLVLPGPAMLVIPVGLAILGAEFAWARHWLRRLREGADAVWQGGTSLWNGTWRRDGGSASGSSRPGADRDAAGRGADRDAAARGRRP